MGSWKDKDYERLAILAAKQFGTPLYLYDESRIQKQLESLRLAFSKFSCPVDIHYSVKANSNQKLLGLLSSFGVGFDIVSGGELYRLQRLKVPGEKIVFSGVGKSKKEILEALKYKILQFNVESEAELKQIESCAKDLNIVAPIALRVNPDVDAETHEYITTGTEENKFGIPMEEALEIYKTYKKSSSLNFVGVDMHIGSQLTKAEPIRKAAKRFAEFTQQVLSLGIDIINLDVGGGLGVAYQENEKVLKASEFANLIEGELKALNLYGKRVLIEPGRFLICESGVLVTELLYKKIGKKKVFYIVDASMTELIRPMLYEAHHDITAMVETTEKEKLPVDIVGPVCETTDCLGKNREMLNCESGDLLMIHNAGAYGQTLSSRYNTRPHAAEVLIRAKDHSLELILPRGKVEDLIHEP